MKVEGTKTTPSVTIEKGIFEMKGRSIPEDAHDFFSPIMYEIQSFMKDVPEKTILEFQLDYINSGSKKYITNILNQFNELKVKGSDIEINWHYDTDDDSILELGRDLMEMFEIPFNLIPVSS